MHYFYRQFIGIGIFFLCALLTLIIIGPTLIDVFSHNFFLNVLIVGIFICGSILFCFQIFRLKKEYEWIDHLEEKEFSFQTLSEPKVLSPIFHGLKNQKNISLLTLKSALSSLEQRLEDKREFNRYIIGLCVFLGLVGTFWGLSKTISAIAGVINGIDINANDIKDSFHNLKTGLQAPLIGMGYAFSSSLFGLTASLALGFLDMQVSKAFIQFYNHVEELLSSIVKDQPSTTISNTGQAYPNALIEQLAETMTKFQAQLERAEESRQQSTNVMQSFLGNLARLDDILRGNLQNMEQINARQVEIQQQFSHILQRQIDDSGSNALKMLDVTTQNILMELSQGRIASTNELKQEIRLISKTISALANG